MAEKTSVIKEVRQFEFYIKYLWPLHRKLVRKYLSKRCNTCFLSENYVPLIDGTCEFCLTPLEEPKEKSNPSSEVMQAEMDQRLKQVIKKSPANYHAVLLFSGGKDSSYLLHRMRQDYPGIRLLAVTIDNTFMSPVAMENISAIIAQTGVDHLLVRPEARTMEKMFRYAFTHLNEKGCSGTVDQFDGDFFSDVARNIAAEKKIPYVICGLSKTQVEQILHLDSFITSIEAESTPRTHVAGIRLKDVFSEKELSYWWDPTKYDSDSLPRMMFPFYIWNLEEEYIKSEVIRLNLMPRGDESPLITNNQLIPLMGIVDMVTYGYSTFEPEFAQMVRAGKADRKQWLHAFELTEYAAKTGRFLSKSMDEILERLSLNRKDLRIKD